MSWVPADRAVAAELLAALGAWERVCRSEGRTMHAELRAMTDDLRRVYGRRNDAERHRATRGDSFVTGPEPVATMGTTRQLLGLREVAGMFGVEVRTVQRWVQAGRLPAVRVGRAARVDPGDLPKLRAR